MSTYNMTSDDLIASVKRRAFLPNQQNTFLNKDFLAFADEEMAMAIVPMILRMHEDYLLYTDIVAVENNISRYAIPYRAVGNKLKELAFQDATGNVFPMTRIDISELPYYNQQAYGRPYAFYVENNEIVLAPTNTYVSSGVFLRMSYFMRPNSLVMLNEVGIITSIDRMTGTLQLSNLPEAFNITKQVDLVQVRSPNKLLKFDISPTAINTTSKTVMLNISDIPDSLSIGDHICLAMQSAIPQIPSDMHVLLPLRVSARCLEAMGDTEGLQSANQKIGESDKQAEALIDNRVDEAPRRIVNRNASIRAGLSRRGRFRGGY